MTELKFGTGGWRAIIGDDFNRENIERVASAVVIYAKRHGLDNFVVGYDNRFLSLEAAGWIQDILSSGGIHTTLYTKSIPTPLLMFVVKNNGYGMGLMVTASHNPYNYNGIKIIKSNGSDADISMTQELEKIINSEESDISNNYVPATIKQPETAEYFKSICSNMNVDKIRQYLSSHNLRFVFDGMNGSGSYIFKTVMKLFGCSKNQLKCINTDKDAYFTSCNGIPKPEEARLKRLITTCKHNHCVGFAFDGDGDRIFVVDEHGRTIDANKLLCLIYYYMKKDLHMAGDAVRNNSTTHLLDQIAKRYNSKAHEVSVGFKWISSTVLNTNSIIGGESSGGIMFYNHILGKDAIYTALYVVDMLCMCEKPLWILSDELDRDFGTSVILNNEYRLSDEKKVEISTIISDNCKTFESSTDIIATNWNDGFKVYFHNGDWVNCRFSGTEPILRIYAEASNKETAQQYVKEMENFVNL